MREGLLIFSRVPLREPGMFREITTKGTAVRCDRICNGRPRGRFAIFERKLYLLGRALRLAEDEGAIRHVGRIRIPSGCKITIGAAMDEVVFRCEYPSGNVSPRVCIRGEELEALRKAFAHVQDLIAKRVQPHHTL